ncbi:MAG: helix-turn-helix domain-containing protein [Lachnospiraceae bacterium]
MKTEVELNHDVGVHIRGLRENMHMTRQQFGELCDISESFLAAVESGKKSITTKTLYKICKETGASADSIIFGEKGEAESSRISSLFQKLEEEQSYHMMNAMEELCKAMQKSN